jgi:tetratricopeptide (TPR) repeat protein
MILSLAARAQTLIRLEYPADGSIFPPEFAPPTFLWRDAAQAARAWTIEVSFSDGAPSIRLRSNGPIAQAGEIDRQAIAPTNALPSHDEALRSWSPEAEIWAAIKKRSTARRAVVTITGFADGNRRKIVSRGSIAIQTSADPVGAPIFYRDVPLMPSELEKGVIKPLPQSALPLINWRLRWVADSESRVLLKGLPTCANCHSFSSDGKTLGMDLDGPQNDKGLYALARVGPKMSIRNEDVISWSSFGDESVARMRVGFMSQVSPDGKYVVTTVSGTKQEDIARSYYVANFTDYRFLQVFYATRGILVWYDRASGRRQALPGADDQRYVQTNAVWSPDGKYLVFARAEARDAYPGGGQMAEFANDPRETQIQYDLCRIPFNGGRGGRAEPIAGASADGMSNSFAKVSPDGRWIVFVKARNGLLMRPGSELYIVPFEGGQARRLRANLPVMNSWHSFSPNGRWLVFSSKGKTPYTQMFLTHLDELGNDSPPILIENATAANRAVNIPEFVNIPAGGLLSIDVPAVEFYRLFDRAYEVAREGRFDEAIRVWTKALEISPEDAKAHNNLAFALANAGRLDEAIEHWQRAVQAGGDYASVHENLGRALLSRARLDEAIPHLRRAVEMDPANAQTRNELGVALSRTGRIEEALAQFEKALEVNGGFAQARVNLGNAYYMLGRVREAVAEWRNGLHIEPDRADALNQTAWVLATSPEETLRDGAEAVRLATRAVELTHGNEPAYLDTLAAAYAEVGRFAEATRTARQALSLAERTSTQPLAEALRARLALYDASRPFRENPRRPEPAGTLENR